MAKKVEFEDCINDARKIDSKDFTGIGYMLKIELTLDENDEYAVKGRITYRSYTLGTYHKWDWSNHSELRYGEPTLEISNYSCSTPSKIQAKLNTRKINFNVLDLENHYIKCAIGSYNSKIDYAKATKCKADFESRANAFMKELKAIKEKYKVDFDYELFYNDYDNADLDVSIVDTMDNDHYHEKYIGLEDLFKD